MNVYQIRQKLRTKSIYDIGLRVAFYARVSTEKEEQKNSIKNQREHFEELIASNKKWTFAGGYIDDGISGIHAEKRERFQQMIKDAKKGKFDLLITKEISRFARNTLDSIQYTRELLAYGVCVWFQNDNINTADEDSEFRLTIMAGVAQDEIRKLSSRVRFGHERSIKNGVVMGNSRLYGYDKANGRLTVNENEAPMIRIIFEKYASGEWGTQKLEHYLYEMGYRNYKGGRISSNVIKHIIVNPKYKGWFAGGKVKIVDMFTKKQEFLPQEEWVLYKDDGSRVPAIVSEELWEQANKVFRRRSDIVKERKTSFKNDNLFTGKLICANDGCKYWLRHRHVRGKEDAKWVCSHHIRHGADSCDSFPVDETELKIMLSKVICDIAPCFDDVADKYLEIYENAVLSQEDDSREISALEKQIDGIKKRMEKILDYNLSGEISDNEFIRRNREYENQITVLESRLKEISQKSCDEGQVEVHLRRLSNVIKKYDRINEDDITRPVLDELIDKIYVIPAGDHKAQIEFVLNNGERASGCYDRVMHCSGNIVKKMIEQQEKQMAGK